MRRRASARLIVSDRSNSPRPPSSPMPPVMASTSRSRAGRHAGRDGDRDPGQVHLHQDAVLGLAVRERDGDGLVVTEHVVAAPGPAGRRLADLGHPFGRVDALACHLGQGLAGRPLGRRRAHRHEQPEQGRAVRVTAAACPLHEHGGGGTAPPRRSSRTPSNPRDLHAGRGLDLGLQRLPAATAFHRSPRTAGRSRPPRSGLAAACSRLAWHGTAWLAPLGLASRWLDCALRRDRVFLLIALSYGSPPTKPGVRAIGCTCRIPDLPEGSGHIRPHHPRPPRRCASG